MTYLSDTDWVIDHLNHIERVTRRLGELAPAGLALSIISLAELYEGIYYSRDPVESEAALRHNLTLLTNNRRHFERSEGLRMESV
jgi:tRNA(fMet)-specific endonuclease VapC